MRQWEALFWNIVNGTGKLSDRLPSVLRNGFPVPGIGSLPLDAVEYPSKAHVVGYGQTDEIYAY